MSAPEPGPFDEPWQAQAFAMVVALNEAGRLDWGDWARALSEALHAPDVAPDGGDYHDRWLIALERVLADAGIAGAGEIDALTDRWQRAAANTPHGAPVLLDNA